MKRILLMLCGIVLCSMAAKATATITSFEVMNVTNVNGVSFRTTQKVSNKDGSQHLEFYKDGTFVLRTATARVEGTYSLDGNEIVAKAGDLTFRGSIVWFNSKKTSVVSITFEGETYKPFWI
jgi:outer membrane lipoprotein-sorting protein